ncbi:hypothetical protein [Pseudomonas sp. NPDC096950]|uniref:hypothetical protein n=1 Tax=Pseudomonas sp. NPDC096950 TaxID=3364485 RepID=UPI00383A36AC
MLNASCFFQKRLVMKSLLLGWYLLLLAMAWKLFDAVNSLTIQANAGPLFGEVTWVDQVWGVALMLGVVLQCVDLVSEMDRKHSAGGSPTSSSPAVAIQREKT